MSDNDGRAVLYSFIAERLEREGLSPWSVIAQHDEAHVIESYAEAFDAIQAAHRHALATQRTVRIQDSLGIERYRYNART